VTRVPEEDAAARALQREFERLGRERAVRARGATRRRSPRTIAVALGVLLGLAGAAAATTSLLVDDDPITAEPRLPRDLAPAPADRRLSPLRVADPGGGPAWGVRSYTNRSGARCVVLGRVRDGRLGTLRGGRFAPYAADVPGTCGSRPSQHLVLAANAVTEPAPRVVVHGLADRAVTFVGLTRGGVLEEIPVAPDGAFLHVEVGSLGALRDAEVVTRIAGRERRERLVR
jgi:hypothetical protein